jgi:hypothetical protein
MNKLWVIIALVVATSLYTFNSGCSLKTADYYSTKENSEWHYVPCNGTTKNCGRLQ